MAKKVPAKRNPVAFDLNTNGLYRPKTVKSKKAYSRKARHARCED